MQLGTGATWVLETLYDINVMLYKSTMMALWAIGCKFSHCATFVHFKVATLYSLAEHSFYLAKLRTGNVCKRP